MTWFKWGISEDEEKTLQELIKCRKRQGRDRLGLFNVTQTARNIHGDIDEGLEKAEIFLDAYLKTGNQIAAFDALAELLYVNGLDNGFQSIHADDEFLESFEDCGRDCLVKYREIWEKLDKAFENHTERYYSLCLEEPMKGSLWEMK